MHSTDAPPVSGMDDTTDIPVSYRVPRAAELIGVSERRMWDMVRDRRIESFMAEGRRLISRRALEEYVAAKEKEAA